MPFIMSYPSLLPLCLILSATPALAESAAEAPPPPPPLTATVSYASDYMFRGMTQTWGGPAAQLSVDYAHASGAFASFWTSNVSPKQFSGGHAEIDLSGGYRGNMTDDWSYGVGAIHVMYPGANYSRTAYGDFSSQKYDFTETNATLAWRWLSFKLNYAVSDLLGFNEKTGYSGHTRGSTYLEVNAEVPIVSDLSLGLHAGRQHVKARYLTPSAAGSTNPDFTDLRIALNKRFDGGWLTSLAWSRNLNGAFYNQTPSAKSVTDTYDVGKTRVSVMISKTLP